MMENFHMSSDVIELIVRVLSSPTSHDEGQYFIYLTATAANFLDFIL